MSPGTPPPRGDALGVLGSTDGPQRPRDPLHPHAAVAVVQVAVDRRRVIAIRPMLDQSRYQRTRIPALGAMAVIQSHAERADGAYSRSQSASPVVS